MATLLYHYPSIAKSQDDTDRTPLHQAAALGQLKIVSLLLKHDAEINALTKDGFTPLHASVLSGSLNVVKFLVEQNARVDSEAKDGSTPLISAAINGSLSPAPTSNHKACENFLLQALASINPLTKKRRVDPIEDPPAAAPLQASLETRNCAICQSELFHPFLPLLVLARAHDPKSHHLYHRGCVTTLLTSDSDATCPLCRIEEPFEDFKIQYRLGNGEDPLSLLSEYMNRDKPGNITTILKLTKISPDTLNEEGLSALHYSAKKGHTDLANFLLDNGANINHRDKDNNTALHWATYSDRTHMLELLLEKGAEPNCSGENGDTPLHWAAIKGKKEAARTLLKRGAKIDPLNIDVLTPTYYAAAYGHGETLSFLIANGSEVQSMYAKLVSYAKGKVDRQTPLHGAVENGHVSTARILIAARASLGALTEDNETPLHLAARAGSTDTAKLALYFGSPSNTKNKDGYTPLHLAAREGHDPIVEALLAHKCDSHSKARGGETPLITAATRGHLSTVKLLCKHAEENGYVIADRSTAYSKAKERGHEECAEFLKSQ